MFDQLNYYLPYLRFIVSFLMSLHIATLFKNLKNKAVFPLKLFFKILKINETLNQDSLHLRRFSKRQHIWTSDEAVHNSSVDFNERIQNIPQPQQPQTQQKQQRPQQQQKQAKHSVNSNDIGNNINLQNNRSNETKKSVFVIGDSTVKTIHSKNNFAYQFRQP